MTCLHRMVGALVLIILTGGCVNEDTAMLLRPDVDNSGERVIGQPDWASWFVLGGTAEDTLLQMPAQLVADSSGVTFVDMYAARVVRISQSGDVVWAFGRQGAGPDEFQHLIALALDRKGSAWALDRRNHRVTVIDHTGLPIQRIPLSNDVVEPSGLAPADDGSLLLFTSNTAAPLVRVTGTGRIRETEPFPWDGFSELHPLATQMLVASEQRDGTLALAFQLGNGLVIRPERGGNAVRANFVEATPFPVVSVATEGTRTVSSVEDAKFSARSLSVDGSCVYVHFVGQTDSRSRVIDVYSQGGEYKRSFALPRKVSRLAVHGGAVYAHYSDPFPTLVAWHSPELMGPTACQ